MGIIYGGRAVRIEQPRKSKEYKALEVRHYDRLQAGSWLAACPKCGWLGLAEESAAKTYSTVIVDGFRDGNSLCCQTGTIRICPVCLTKDEISDLYDPKDPC